jgi:hypothetical protein
MINKAAAVPYNFYVEPATTRLRSGLLGPRRALYSNSAEKLGIIVYFLNEEITYNHLNPAMYPLLLTKFEPE